MQDRDENRTGDGADSEIDPEKIANETVKSILDEEKQNRRKRRASARPGYQPVEKDW